MVVGAGAPAQLQCIGGYCTGCPGGSSYICGCGVGGIGITCFVACGGGGGASGSAAVCGQPGGSGGGGANCFAPYNLGGSSNQPSYTTYGGSTYGNAGGNSYCSTTGCGGSGGGGAGSAGVGLSPSGAAYGGAGGAGIYHTTFTDSLSIGQLNSGHWYVAGGGGGSGAGTCGAAFAGAGGLGCGGAAGYCLGAAPTPAFPAISGRFGGGGGGSGGSCPTGGGAGGDGMVIIATRAVVAGINIGATYVTNDTCIAWTWNGKNWLSAGCMNNAFDNVCNNLRMGYGSLTALGYAGQSFTYCSFTLSGSYSWVAPSYTTNLSAMIVAGGGGGGNAGSYEAGGGGAGGVVITPLTGVTPGCTYCIVIGGGGGSQTAGSISYICGPGITCYVACGGGAGAGVNASGGAGGSGGGGSYYNGGAALGGASNQTTYPNAVIYGTSGGAGCTTAQGSAGGGGGAVGVGVTAPNVANSCSAGGCGLLNPWQGSLVGCLSAGNRGNCYYIAGGGGGGGFAPATAPGGAGGGGLAVGYTYSVGPYPNPAFFGSGGGTQWGRNGCPGAAGLVIIALPAPATFLTQYNTGIGGFAGTNITSGYCNIAFGFNSSCGVTTACNTIAVGYNSTPSNTTGHTVWGNASNNVCNCNYVAWTNVSDRRDKANVTPLLSTLGLTFVTQLSPVSFNWDNREIYKLENKNKDGSLASIKQSYGLIAQDVVTVLNALSTKFDAVGYDSDKDAYRITYEGLLAPIIQSIKAVSYTHLTLPTIYSV